MQSGVPMKKTCLVAFAFAAGLAASAFAQVPPPSVRYVEHPQAARIGEGEGVVFRAVSYTHLDVYKRQSQVVTAASPR